MVKGNLPHHLPELLRGFAVCSRFLALQGVNGGPGLLVAPEAEQLQAGAARIQSQLPFKLVGLHPGTC